jgi:hypothetical protein
VAKRRQKKWIQGAIQRPGALTAYAKGHGGMTKRGTISRPWAQGEQRRLRAKAKRTPAETRRLRQINLFLDKLAT